MGDTENRLDIPLNVREQHADDQDVVEIFHENTKYQRSTLLPHSERISLFQGHPTFVNRSVRGYKTYPFASVIPLFEPAPVDSEPFRMFRDRRSVRSFSDTEVELPVVGEILHQAIRCNCTRVSTTGARVHFRPYPSGGGLFPIEFYLLLLRTKGVRPCIAHYDPRRHCLEVIDGEFDVERVHDSLIQRDVAKGASAAVAMTALCQRSTTKYGSRGYRFALLEAGHAGQNLCLVAGANGLGSLVLGGFFDDEIEKLLQVDGVVETVVSVVLMGYEKQSESGGGTGGLPGIVDDEEH